MSDGESISRRSSVLRRQLTAAYWERPFSVPQAGSANTDEVPVIVTCLKKRFSGVSGTINALLPVQARLRPLGYLGAALPGAERAVREFPNRFRPLTLSGAVKLCRRPLPDGSCRIWHLRRDHEMLLGLYLRDELKLPIRLVFTSAAIRRHSLVPRWLIRRMDAVIATTPRAASFFPGTKAVIGHGVDWEVFHPPADRLRAWAETGLPGKLGIGVFGRVRHEKGVHLFVRALLPLLTRFPDFTAVIGGLCQPADRAYAEGLRAEVQAAGLTDRVVWLGEIPPTAMSGWYQRVLITVACPVYEGFGLTPIEAMASGCAVVASRTGAFEQMVEEGVTGHLVPPDDLSALRQALEPLMQSPENTVAMGQLGRQRAQGRFSIEAEAQAIEQVYQQVWGR